MKLLADYTITELKELLFDAPEYRAKQLFKWVSAGATFAEMTDLPKQLKARLCEEFSDLSLEIIKEVLANDGSTKLLYRLHDGNIIEGIFMPHDYGNTLCVSTQVGCRMRCAFCASGLDGLVRNLSAGEIYGQVIAANRRFLSLNLDNSQGLSNENESANSAISETSTTPSTPTKVRTGRAITNIVLMGSGEPLDNYDAVTKFIGLVTDAGGLGLSQRGISLSTCGIPSGIRKLADDNFSVTLSVSLHATTDEVRQELMLIAKTHRIKDVLDAARYYFAKTGRRIVIEYAMIKQKNVTLFDAKRLKTLLSGMATHINLIPLNYVKESALIPASKQESQRFLARLKEQNLSATVRKSAGSEVSGACGQLRRKFVGDKDPANSGQNDQESTTYRG